MTAFRSLRRQGRISGPPLLAPDGDPGHGPGWNGETWGASQKISLDETIKVNSFNGAYNSREEKDKGSIAAGKLADFVMLAEDLHAIDPSKIKDVKIARTVVGGRSVYQA